MAYHWRPETGSYSMQSLRDQDLLQDFDTQAAAESWLTLFYEDLLQEGVGEVSLYEGDRLVYGPMALEA